MKLWLRCICTFYTYEESCFLFLLYYFWFVGWLGLMGWVWFGFGLGLGLGNLFGITHLGRNGNEWYFLAFCFALLCISRNELKCIEFFLGVVNRQVGTENLVDITIPSVRLVLS